MQFELPGSFLKDEFRTQIGATRFISPEIVENDVRGDIQRQEENFRNMAGELLKILDARQFGNYGDSLLNALIKLP